MAQKNWINASYIGEVEIACKRELTVAQYVNLYELKDNKWIKLSTYFKLGSGEYEHILKIMEYLLSLHQML